jgi:TIR domain
MGKKKATRRNSQRSYQVFVSHATADKWLATIICHKLEEAGATTFRDDRDINGGDDIPDRLRHEIMRSREMLVLVTPESINRPWVLLEVGGAWLRGMRITPILCHVAVDRIPEIIRSKKAVNLNDFEAYVESIRHQLQNR